MEKLEFCPKLLLLTYRKTIFTTNRRQVVAVASIHNVTGFYKLQN
jgi:hypothetical protein